ncbi:MAG: DUF494 family protein [Calditrichaeota bacterium]|nr:MAG: DUF494 family protein [Calditrichota bacterium]MBL1207119.1 DUF494 family protein [Calditrichota bacterium]NOG46949.1 DUF494 family protein [Calditrichota bacterium]
MQERIIEIIVYLLEEFQQTPTNENYTDLSKELISRGYTESEINFAFSWIFNHLQKSGEDQLEFNYAPDSIRVLHDLEKLVIAPEAYGYLLQLLHLGMIKEVDMEDVIERALSIGSTHISLEDIKSMAASVIFNPETNPSLEGFFFHQGTNTIH